MINYSHAKTHAEAAYNAAQGLGQGSMRLHAPIPRCMHKGSMGPRVHMQLLVTACQLMYAL